MTRSGIRPDDVASPTGLNWNVNAGGKIIRIQRDKPDESFLGLDSEGWDICMTSRHYWGYRWRDSGYMGYPIWTHTDGKFYFLRDLEPDMFVLNLNGENIPFLITESGVSKNGVKILMLNDNKDIFIEYLENEYNYLQSPKEASPTYAYQLDQLIHDYPEALRNRECSSNTPFDKYLPYSAFKVTDTNGKTYYFGLDVSSREYTFSQSTINDANYLSVEGQAEKKEKHALAGTIMCSPTAWMISKITQPKGSVKSFDKYKLEDKYQEINFNYSRGIHISETKQYNESFVEQTGECSTVTYVVTSFNDSPIAYQAILSSIESDNFVVKFNAPEIFSLNVSNMASMIPEYSSTDFTSTTRLDIEGAAGNNLVPSQVQQNQTNFLNHSKTITNPLKEVPNSPLIRNILVLDKTTGKKLGYYLHYDYYVNQNDKRQLSVLSDQHIYKKVARTKYH